MGKRKRKEEDPTTKLRSCRMCGLSRFRRNVVPYRLIGPPPARLLFIGEAPGRSEDLRGEAFIGPSGKLLNQLLLDAGAPESALIVNCVCCRPCDTRGGDNREPRPTEVLTCRRNITAIIRLFSAPEAVIFLGAVAERFWRGEYPDGLALRHPAYLLRTGGLASPMYLGQVRLLEDVIKAL